MADVNRIYKANGKVLVAVSEGIHYADGSFVSETKTSATDIEEACAAGREAVEQAVKGVTGQMVAFEREMVDGKYHCKLVLLPLDKVANYEKKVPLEWINEDGNGLKPELIDYVLPLIQGEPKLPLVDSLPRYAKLKKVLAK